MAGDMSLRLGRFTRLAPPLTAILLLAACARSYPPAPVEFRGAQGGQARPTTSAPAVAARSQGAPVQVAAANVARPQSHRVQKGETIYTVARRYGVENSALVRANNLPPPYRLEAGQVLNIPGGTAQPMPTTVEASTAPASAGASVAPAALPTDPVRRGVDSAPLAAPGRTSAAPVTAAENHPVQTANASSAPITPSGAVSAPKAPEPHAAVEPIKPAAPVAAAPEPIKVPARPASPVIEASANSSAATAGRNLTAPDVGLPSRDGRSFQWPLRGQIVSEFGAKSGGLHNDGINIAATQGAAVRASEAGTVVYAGNEVRGFGNLLLIRHADGWMTAYAHVDEMLVRRDDQVRRGQTIAKVGRTGNVTTPQLHFEIRRGTRSVNPREFLQPETASLN
jgi:murein DD-endopeptidase MepM/ murein hydrolase activator NlpD